MFNRSKWLILALAIVAVVAFAAFGFNRQQPVNYFTAQVERGDVRQVVEATGTINAVTTVEVGSQVSGTISQLFADFNSQVKRGQVIAQIDASLFEGALLQARADLENARANAAAARANLERVRAAAVQAQAEYQRTEALAKAGVMSQQQLEVARANTDSAHAQVRANEAQMTQAEAQVKQREAAVQVAQTNLNHTTIRAPIDGTVVSRNVDVGQTVAASLQAPTLFTIAQDLTRMQVFAKTDESDVGQIKVGQEVNFKVDAFPREQFRGRVVQIRMNPTTVQNVVTYDTVVEFLNPDRKLFPGMTAYLTIPVAHARNTLRVPNAALRFRPDMSAEEMRATLDQHGIKMTGGGGGRRGGGQGGPGGAGGGQRRAQQQQQQQEGGQPGAEAEQASQPQPREVPVDVGLVWKKRADASLEPVQVRIGITDFTLTEITAVMAGNLEEGDELVTGTATGRRAAGPGGARLGGIAGGPQRR